jgi:hypothetical protein
MLCFPWACKGSRSFKLSLTGPNTNEPNFRKGPEVTKPPSIGDILTPPSQQFQTLRHKISLFCPRLGWPCQTRVTPAAGWIANVSSQVGGNAPGQARKRQRGLTGEAMANAVPLAGGALTRVPCKASHRAGVPFLPVSCGRGAGQRSRACGGHGACFASGSVPEHAPKAAPAVCPGRGRGNPGGGP